MAYQSFGKRDDARAEIAYRNWVETQVPPGGRIVASLEISPLFTRSAFYHLATSSAPSGYDTAHIMRDMKRPPFSGRFTEQHYIDELEQQKPDVILVRGWYSPLQRRAIDTYIARNRQAFRQVDGPRGAVLVRAHR
ncbi:MAG: hypothetical protein H7X95_02830, partial [Deltaproteobacteria bacterium]|nr:hypothetical protein [Deltaproteobacteria bacterium]